MGAPLRVLVGGFAVVIVALWPVTSTAQAPPHRYSTQLRKECESLVQLAVRRPFGWGWDPALRTGDLRRPTSRPVSMEPLNTPAAGLVLLWAGQLLQEPKFVEAAHEAARGVAASQLPTGKIPSIPIFTTTAGGRDAPAIIPDRASTRAAMTLLLIVLDQPDQPRNERLERAARRAAQWLIQQQTDIGGWPSIHPPDAEPRDATRILRLDIPDYRDSSLAMVLAGDVLKERIILRANEKMMSHLLLLRRDEPGARGHSLWYTAYKASGIPAPDLVDAPRSVDLLASRYAMQLLMGAYLLNGEKTHGMALDTAALTISMLQRPDKQWVRHPESPELSPPAFGLLQTSDLSLPAVLDSTTQLRAVGRQRYSDLLEANFTVRQHLAATIVGLTDTPFTQEMPISSEESARWFKQHDDQLRPLFSPLPQTLHERVQRLWLLLRAAQAERY